MTVIIVTVDNSKKASLPSSRDFVRKGHSRTDPDNPCYATCCFVFFASPKSCKPCMSKQGG